MIPKVIHYCWFGGNPLPDSAVRCIASWRKFCPDYEIIEWNESNYDVNKIPYMQQAYARRKWSFVSDYARLDIVYRHGGIYLDTDVELLRSLDSLRNYEGFMGFEDGEHVASGLGFGAAPGNTIIREMMDMYEQLSFLHEDGSADLTPTPVFSTRVLLQHGLVQNNARQQIAGVEIFPSEYFCPLNFKTGKKHLTPQSYSIHWYDASWYDPACQYEKRLNWKLNKLLPAPVAYNISRFAAVARFDGLSEACRKTVRKMRKGKGEERL